MRLHNPCLPFFLGDSIGEYLGKRTPLLVMDQQTDGNGGKGGKRGKRPGKRGKRLGKRGKRGERKAKGMMKEEIGRGEGWAVRKLMVSEKNILYRKNYENEKGGAIGMEEKWKIGEKVHGKVKEMSKVK